MIDRIKGTRAFPSFFSNPGDVRLSLKLTPAELDVIARQASASGRASGGRFSASLVMGIVTRCQYGYPKALLCNPLTGVHPFPTVFWLSCPHLLKVIGHIENWNGVASMEDFLKGKEAEWMRYRTAYALLRLSLIPLSRRRFLREHRRRIFSSLQGSGVGGVKDVGGHIFVKCIHLQAASFLGMGDHPASEWLKANITSWDCDGGRCRRKDRGALPYTQQGDSDLAP
jgi:hypothetical protein